MLRTTKTKVCNCSAYNFPHRLDSGKCRELYNSNSDESYREFNKNMLRDFNRTEAHSINRALT